MTYMRVLQSVIFVCLYLSVFHSCAALMSQLQQPEAQCPARCTCSTHLKRVSCIGLRLRNIPPDIPSSVTELYLSHNLLTEIGSGAFQNLTSLSILSLESNLIEKIDDGAFVGLHNLTMLYLKANKLRSLSSEVFRDLGSLMYLYLTQNQLEALPDLRYAQNLIRLILDNNMLKSARIPDGFMNLTKLSTLVLSNNRNLMRITDVDFSALNHSTIRKIDVTRCNLNDVGQRAFNFSHLQSLVLSYNTGWNETFLHKVLSSLSGCSELTSLDLSGVINLGQLPADIFSSLSTLPLKHLNLAHSTKVAVIEDGTFQYFPSMEMLDLSNSEFRIIKDSMSEAKKLKTLKLSHNDQLQLVPTLKLDSLELLDLSSCRSFEELGSDSFLHLPKLTNLVMHDCGIHRIHEDAFTGLDHLQKLDLSNNVIGSSSLPVKLFEPLIVLNELDLSNNKLEQILTESNLFHGLGTLTVLDLSENQCSMVPEDIFNPLTSLISLDLSQNNLGDGVVTGGRGGKLFQKLNAIERLMLMENNIQALPVGLFDNLYSLEMLNMSHNHLHGWNGSAFNALANLSVIDFSANKVTVVPESSVVPLMPRVKLNLSGNPFSCWCDLMWFRNWIAQNNITDAKLPGLATYKCSSPAAMVNKPLLDFDPKAIVEKCLPPPWLIITVTVSSGVAVIIIFIVAVCYKYRWPIRLKIYKLRKRVRGDPDYERLDEAAEDQYDVYVSYGPSDSDKNWVKTILMPVIDARERTKREQKGDDVAAASDLGAFRAVTAVSAYWEHRDMVPGTPEIGAVCEAISGSRKILLVISSEYIKDGRREFELQMVVDKSCKAHHQLADIAVVLLDVAAALRLPKFLRPKLDEALEWTPDDPDGQQLFWQKLDEFLHGDVPMLTV